jgi:hypothetical protein
VLPRRAVSAPDFDCSATQLLVPGLKAREICVSPNGRLMESSII